MRWVARSGALIKSNKILSSPPPPPSTFKSHKLLFFMIIGCSWSWIVRWLLCEQNYEVNTRARERDCHSTQGCGASAWWTFPFYSAASIHIHESEIFYGCYAAVVVADDRSIYCVLNCCCLTAIRKLQIMRKTSLFCSIFNSSSKIPTMSWKICIIIILNYIFLRVQSHHILTLYRNSSQQNRKSLNFHFQFQNSHGYWIINYVRGHLNQKCRIHIHTRMDPRATKLTKKKINVSWNKISDRGRCERLFFCSLSHFARRDFG